MIDRQTPTEVSSKGELNKLLQPHETVSPFFVVSLRPMTEDLTIQLVPSPKRPVWLR